MRQYEINSDNAPRQGSNLPGVSPQGRVLFSYVALIALIHRLLQPVG